MKIKLEIHAPGLDLHHERWNHHVLFMDKVHAHGDRIAACAWTRTTELGRGALYVDKNDWMEIIKGDAWMESSLFPCTHVDGESGRDVVDTAPLGAGFLEMLETFDPEKEVILLVQHHPGDQLSCYLVEPGVAPPEAAADLGVAGTGEG